MISKRQICRVQGIATGLGRILGWKCNGGRCKQSNTSDIKASAHLGKQAGPGQVGTKEEGVKLAYTMKKLKERKPWNKLSKK